MPVGMTPLTPGTNKKFNEVLKGSFEPWVKEAQNRNITKGKLNKSRRKKNSLGKLKHSIYGFVLQYAYSTAILLE